MPNPPWQRMADDGLKPFQRLQRDFAAYVRDPDNAPPPPGIEPRRMAVYARLVYNNVESVLASVFGDFADLLGKAPWRALVRDFLRRHRAASPYYGKLPDEFLEYLQSRDDGPEVPPFAFELCHYAWVKYTLPRAPDVPSEAFDDCAIASDDAVAVSPLAWPLTYAFPVTDIGPDCRPSTPPEQPTYLIAYRDRHDEVRFMASNALTLRLLGLIQQGSPPKDAFAEIAAQLGTPLARVESAGIAILNRLHSHDVVLRTLAGPLPKMDEK